MVNLPLGPNAPIPVPRPMGIGIDQPAQVQQPTTNPQLSMMQKLGNNYKTWLALGTGLLAGKTGPEQMALGAQGFGNSIDAKKQQVAKNATIELLAKRDPLLAKAVQTGEMGINQAMTRMMTGANAKGVTYGKQIIPYVKEDGSIGAVMAGSDGTVQEVQPPQNGEWDPNLFKVATDTNTQLVDMAGNVRKTIDSNVQEGAAQKEIGTAKGKAEGTAPERASKAMGLIESIEAQQQTAIEDIDRAIELLESDPYFATGFFGGYAQALPGTPAFNLRALTKTARSKAGFDKLQEMRDNSPTGGALGQVSNFEIGMLQATFGDLDVGQNKEQLMHNLKRLKEIMQSATSRRREAFSRDYSQYGINTPGTPTADNMAPNPEIDSLVEKWTSGNN